MGGEAISWVDICSKKARVIEVSDGKIEGKVDKHEKDVKEIRARPIAIVNVIPKLGIVDMMGAT